MNNILQNIAKDISNKINQAIIKNIREPQSSRSNWISQIGHPCMRYLVYKRLDGEKAQKITIEKAKLFEGGEIYEALAKKRFLAANLPITKEQKYFSDKTINLIGKIDFMLKYNDLQIPLEVKGISDLDFALLNTEEDFYKSPKYYIRGYPAQLQLYMHLNDAKIGIFYIISKKTLQDKIIPIEYNKEYVQSLYDKVMLINDFVKNKTYPDAIEYDQFICGECEFKETCKS